MAFNADKFTFCVQYLDGVAPSPRASVHSKVTIIRVPFFFAMQVTWRVAAGDCLTAGATEVTNCLPTKVPRSCIVNISFRYGKINCKGTP